MPSSPPPTNPTALFRWALSIRRKKMPEASDLFFLEGPKAIGDALRRGVRLHCVLGDESGLASLGGDLPDGLAAVSLPRHRLRLLSHTTTPQGVLAIAVRPSHDATELLSHSEARAVYLDGVQDPGNVGAIVRAAWSLGASHVVVGPETADPFSPKSARASAGSELTIPILFDPDGSLPRRLVAGSFGLVAAESGAAITIHELAPLPPRWMLILGSEGRGVRPELSELVSQRFRIPLVAGADSLNVALAGAIILFQLLGEDSRSSSRHPVE